VQDPRHEPLTLPFERLGPGLTNGSWTTFGPIPCSPSIDKTLKIEPWISSRRPLDAMPVECKILRCRRLYLSATDPIFRSVATLQSPRDRLAGCSSWPLRFAVYSSGGNSSRKSSSWRWVGICAFHSPIVTLEELLAERGLHADHVTAWRWVQRTPELQRCLRRTGVAEKNIYLPGPRRGMLWRPSSARPSWICR
jgi:hypothetical protein